MGQDVIGPGISEPVAMLFFGLNRKGIWDEEEAF
jgi:hypothetical protein